MRVNKRRLRQIIREEKRKILKEEVSLAKAPCPHATADALMASGMSAGEILGWINSLITDLSQAEVSPPDAQILELPAPVGSALPTESKYRSYSSYKKSTPARKSTQTRRLAGMIPGYGFTRNY